MTIRLVVPGVPVPLARARVSRGRHYLPARSREYRELVQAEWMVAGRASLDTSPFTLSARFYGARASADLDNLVKAVLDALNRLAFADDSQVVCLSGCHKLPVDDRGPRAEIELWPSERGAAA
ncbi:MAG: crossover junction endodeoxyribonuclease RusA [Solirubrobacteraceae bacterium]|jgi:crossover junction endodeoxyribonuclease RusA|nr:crossover junction endodeoxyribonuclease RusA [Solirubrobacteraceae bacterium]